MYRLQYHPVSFHDWTVQITFSPTHQENRTQIAASDREHNTVYWIDVPIWVWFSWCIGLTIITATPIQLRDRAKGLARRCSPGGHKLPESTGKLWMMNLHISFNSTSRVNRSRLNLPMLVHNHLPKSSIKSSTLFLTNSLDQFWPLFI